MDCSTFAEVTLSEWTDEIFAPLKGQRYPLMGSLELIDRCNLACVHCYINQPAASSEARKREMTTQQVKGILDQVADAGCLFLLLTGGEILLRSDFSEIYRYVKQKGMLVNLFTNGTLLTPRIADLLAEYRPRTIELTMYGATQATYEQVTGVAGSYARFRRGIDLLLERGLPLILKSVLLTSNQHEFPEMRAFIESLGLMYRFDNLLWPRLDGDLHPQDYQISLEEIVALDANDPERREAFKEMLQINDNHLVRGEHIYSCGAGFRSFHIDSVGLMSLCMMSRQPSFSLLQMSFTEAWASLGELRKMKRTIHSDCQTCDLGEICTQCPGWSQAVHQDNETPVKFICDLAHLRADRLRGN